MVKRFFILLGFLCLSAVFWIAGRFFYIEYTYNHITVPISAQELRDKMGNPNTIRPSFNDDDTENSMYYQFPVPHSFEFYIKDGIVIRKYDEISG